MSKTPQICVFRMISKTRSMVLSPSVLDRDWPQPLAKCSQGGCVSQIHLKLQRLCTLPEPSLHTQHDPVVTGLLKQMCDHRGYQTPIVTAPCPCACHIENKQVSRSSAQHAGIPATACSKPCAQIFIPWAA